MDIARASTLLHQTQLQHEVGMRVLGMAIENAGNEQEMVRQLSTQAAQAGQPITDSALGSLIDVQA